MNGPPTGQMPMSDFTVVLTVIFLRSADPDDDGE